MKKEIKKRLERWEAEGWNIKRTRGGHYKLTHSAAHKPVFVASTPSDARSLKNIEEDLRHALDVKYKT